MKLTKRQDRAPLHSFLTQHGIDNDPNRTDDPESILRLIGQVIHVSLETVKRTRELAALALLPSTAKAGPNTTPDAL